MSLEYTFTPLATLKVTRIARPQMATTQILDSTLVPLADCNPPIVGGDEEEEKTQCLNDVAERAWSYDNMLLFPAKFGYFC